MPIWFYNKETETPQIYGSYEAVSKNEDIDIKVLHNHFSLPYNIEPLRKLKVIQKRIQDPKSKFKPKYLEYVFAINRLLNNKSFYELEKLIKTKYNIPINIETNVRDEKMNIIFTKKVNNINSTDEYQLVFKTDASGTTQHINIHINVEPIYKELFIELDKHIKKYKYGEVDTYDCNLLHIPVEELVNILNEEILPVVIELINNYEKKYHTSYSDEKYELHKLDIIRA